MIYVLIFIVWTNIGDVQIATANLPSQHDCDVAAANVMSALKANPPAGIIAARTDCEAYSNPSTEHSAATP